MPICIPKRYILIILSQIGFMVVYALRVNLSVAIVSMVNSTYAKARPDPECSSGKNNTVKPNGGEFNWDENEKGLVLGSFFYGYILTQIFGGWLATRFGGKWIYGFGVLVTAVLTLLTPLAARTNFYLLITLRILEGIGEGVTFPAMHNIISQWAPPLERTIMTTISFSGQHAGTILALPLSGVLADSSFLGGWPSVFYVFGAAGVLWFIFWGIIGANSPNQDKWISKEERNYIITSLQGCAQKQSKVPWLDIFKSIHVWAIIVGHFSNNWVWYMVLTGLPLYFQEVLDFKLKENAFLSALPFLVGFLCTLAAGVIADKLRRRMLTTKNTRRLMAATGYFPTGIFLMLASYAGCDQITWSVTCMVLATGFLCFNQGSYSSNHLDIGPRYAGILMGITNSFATIPGFVTPSLTGYFTNNDPSRAQYRKVFGIAAAVCAFGGIFYILFASGDVQPWNDVNKRDRNSDEVDPLVTNIQTDINP